MESTARPRRPPRDGRARLGIALVVMSLALVGMGMVHSRTLAEPAPRDAATGSPIVVTPSSRSHRVIAYYFHTQYRCASCRAIEAYSREAIQSAFADQLKDGRLLWKVVNVEVKGNEHFIKDYGLYTKSLVLVCETRGKPAQWKNLEKVWQLLRDKDAFFRYVQDETRSYLGPIS